jgi:hypothetical protein
MGKVVRLTRIAAACDFRKLSYTRFVIRIHPLTPGIACLTGATRTERLNRQRQRA